jgi:hypothetical protein
MSGAVSPTPTIKLSFEINGERFSLGLPNQTWGQLLAIVDRNRIGVQGAFAQAILNEDFLERQVYSGGTLVLAHGRRLRQLVYRPV